MAFHGLLGLLLVDVLPPLETSAVEGDSPVAFTLTGEGASGNATGVSSPEEWIQIPPVAPEPPPVGRRPSRQNIDALERSGGGEEAIGAMEVVLLLPEARELTGLDTSTNATRERQMQRIRTAADRASRTDRRATPNPGETPYLTSSRGPGRERRAFGRTPQAGRSEADRDTATRRAVAGTTLASSAGRPVAATRAPGTAVPEQHRRGLAGRDGDQANVLAVPSNGRPPLARGDSATPTPWRSRRVRDNRNAELLAADLTRSLLSATRRQGRRTGDGSGGVGGPGAAGAGVEAGPAGGRAQPVAPGPGEDGALDTRDPRYLAWQLELRRRVEGALRFPRERALRLDQGTALFRVMVRRNGTLASPPELLRTSGFTDFDQEALQALESAMPAAALPAGLAPSHAVVPFRIPIRFWNPMVR